MRAGPLAADMIVPVNARKTGIKHGQENNIILRGKMIKIRNHAT